MAELELNEKQEYALVAKEEAQFKLQLIKLQCEIAEIELQRKRNELNLT